MKCGKCGYTSFDHNYLCPSCGKDLAKTRESLGISYDTPGSLDDFFAPSTITKVTPPPAKEESFELTVGDEDDFEFTLDD